MTRLLYPGAAASAMRACLDGAPAGGRHTVQSLHGHPSQATLTHLQPVLGPGHVAEPLSIPHLTFSDMGRINVSLIWQAT